MHDAELAKAALPNMKVTLITRTQPKEQARDPKEPTVAPVAQTPPTTHLCVAIW
jgi:hypothetical protein